MVIIEPIGPTLKLSLDRKLIDYCRKKLRKEKLKIQVFLRKKKLEYLERKREK